MKRYEGMAESIIFSFLFFVYFVFMSKILVIGSSNTDMVVRTKRFPQPGETILGEEFYMFPGGKGANQAVAAARLGGDVTFICKLGDDIFGKKALEGLDKEHINSQHVLIDSEVSSGIAMITVDTSGENQIVVASGANAMITPEDLEMAHAAFETCDIILLQLEIPLKTVDYAIQKGYQMGKKVILNPAPAQSLTDELYSSLFLITPNETEAETLTGIPVSDNDSAANAASVLLKRGVQYVIITMGAKGALFMSEESFECISVPKVEVVDTTAAGDIFNGALSVALSEKMTWREAIEWASRAASLSVTRMGAQSSAPYRTELTI